MDALDSPPGGGIMQMRLREISISFPPTSICFLLTGIPIPQSRFRGYPPLLFPHLGGTKPYKNPPNIFLEVTCPCDYCIIRDQSLNKSRPNDASLENGISFPLPIKPLQTEHQRSKNTLSDLGRHASTKTFQFQHLGRCRKMENERGV